ncbi:hypothetical protein [Streptomyces sp. FIT100]|uniref:hypothetical protein n=1 Tax=Streptomyces sp. FIT100 TaxID=2837956 RepID=UPI0021C7E201|nr:hypothetical protein [Streptomyces sp. FIT100]
MNRLAWLGAALVFAAVEAVYVLLRGPERTPEEDLLSYVVLWVVLASPAAMAGVLVWIAWWLRIGVRLAAMDPPAHCWPPRWRRCRPIAATGERR